MSTDHHDFLLLLAQAKDQDLHNYVQFLKAENEVLHAKLPKRITCTPEDRQLLLKGGKPLGAAIKNLISIVSPRTWSRWLKDDEAPPQPVSEGRRGVGRPATPTELQELILRMACDNGWGYSRILGELKKLGLDSICRTTVKNILREHGFNTRPVRGQSTWGDFINRHKKTLWACDFFTKKIWTMTGMVEMYVLFFINVDSRRVHVAGMTAHPDRQWMIQQARNLSMFFADESVKPRFLVRDWDTKFVSEFDTILQADDIEIIRLPFRAPNLNAYAERWVQSVKSECLDHFMVFGEDHLRHLLKEYLAYYHAERPHQAKDNLPLLGRRSENVPFARTAELVCEERLGGLLKHYRPAA